MALVAVCIFLSVAVVVYAILVWSFLDKIQTFQLPLLWTLGAMASIRSLSRETQFEYDAWKALYRFNRHLSRLGKGKTDIEGTCRFLEELIPHLEKQEDRHATLVDVIEQCHETRPDLAWPITLLERANEKRWPGWAVCCLPQTYIPLQTESSNKCAYVWRTVIDLVPVVFYKYRILGHLCGRLILRVELAPDTANFVMSVAPEFEKARLAGWDDLRKPDPVRGVLITTLQTLEAVATVEGEHELKEQWKKARAALLPFQDLWPPTMPSYQI